jgi:D-alanyl-lipoteichoic acid acyltransferase DltB (MBOAT superfamily)
MLGAYEYLTFLVQNLIALPFASQSLAGVAPAKPDSLPVGISFFTFQAIAYLVDIR